MKTTTLSPFLKIPPPTNMKNKLRHTEELETKLEPEPTKAGATAMVQIPRPLLKKWASLAAKSSLSRAKYARAATVYALENGLVFKEVKTFAIKITAQPTE